MGLLGAKMGGKPNSKCDNCGRRNGPRFPVTMGIGKLMVCGSCKRGYRHAGSSR
jgi:hypothetical protein